MKGYTMHITVHTPTSVYLAPLPPNKTHGVVDATALTQAITRVAGYSGNAAVATGTFYIYHTEYGRGDGPYNCVDYYAEPKNQPTAADEEYWG